MPDQFAVMVGMIAHNMRATLDGLAYQLAILAADGNPKEEDLLRVQFPIRIYGPESKALSNRGRQEPCFSFDSGNFKPLGEKYLARLEELQPYKPDCGGRDSPLWLLDRLNNADKHRVVVLLATAAAKVEGFMNVTGPPVDLGGGRFRTPSPPAHRLTTGAPFEDGARIGYIDVRSPADVDMKIKVLPQVRFGAGCDAVTDRNVVHTLRTIRDHVHGIVESFQPEFS